ncbi:DUF72 domain-containing protein [Nitrospira sp. Kam-Ns4a]
MAELDETPKGRIRVGTSGFAYRDWKGPFYPPRLPDAQRLGYYATRFDAVEINATYYAIPGPRSMEGLLRKVGDRFEFVVKAHQDLTHQRAQARDTLPRFLESLAPLAAARQLGCVLAQFPFSFPNMPANRDFTRFLVAGLAPHRVVVEFRHRSWVTDETMAWLREIGAGYCCVDEPRLPNLPPPRAEATADVGYVRFHGRNQARWWRHEKAEERYDYTYSAEELAAWVPKIEHLAERTLRVYVFFNNHVRGQAPANAAALKAQLGLG